MPMKYHVLLIDTSFAVSERRLSSDRRERIETK